MLANAVRRVVHDLFYANRLVRQLSFRNDGNRRGVSAAKKSWSNVCWGLRIEPLEARVLMSTVTWVNSSGGDWNTASNWSGGQVPGASDDAVINVSGNPGITFNSGTDTVNSLTSNSPLTLLGGTLTVNSTVQVNNTFTIDGGTLAGATVQAGSGGQGITVGTSTASRLDGDTVNANVDLTSSYAFLKVKDGLALSGTATLGGAYATIDFENTQTITSGTFVFQGTGGARALNIEGGATVTLGSTVIVQGGNGNVGEVYSSGTAHTLINQGTISANLSGAALNIGSYYAFTFNNQGTMSASGGGALTAKASSGASSTGTISVDGANSNVTLNGTWNGLGTLGATNRGTMNFDGTFNNGGSTISLPTTSGSWVLNGGTINGGTLSIAAGAVLAPSGSAANLLDGVTVNGNISIGNYGFLGVKDGLTLNGTATFAASYATVDFENTETIQSGTFQFGGSGYGFSLGVEGGASVTLASGVTVQGGNGSIGEVSNNGTAHTLINQGTINANAAGRPLTIGSYYPFTFTNQGTVEATGGASLSAKASSGASSTGTLSVDGAGSSLTLNGAWNGLGTLGATNSGTMNLDGSFNNAGSTIALGATGGNWVLDGGTISGGTVIAAAGAVLSPSGNTANLLDGVTFNGNLNVGNYGFLGVKDGLTLNGTATLAASYATIDFENTETIASGTFQFGTSGYGYALGVEGGATVTLGSSVTVQGGNGRIGDVDNVGGTHTLINQGTISAGISGRPLTIASSYPLTFANQGTVEANSGGSLTITAGNGASNTGTLSVDGSGSSLTFNDTWSGLGTLSATNGGSMNFDGTFNNAGSLISLGNTGGNWILNGGTISGGTLNIAAGAVLTPSGSNANLLDNVTVNGNISVGSYCFLGVKDGLTLNGTATFAGSYAVVDFENTETINSGTFQFGTGGNGYLLAVDGGASVTLGSVVTVQGGNATLGEVSNVGSAHTLINQGTITANASGKTLTVGSSYGFTFVNQGVVQADGGGKLTVSAGNGASSSGTLSADGTGSALTLNGSWTGLGTLSATNGGTMNFDGTFNNAGSTVALGATGGNWAINGGVIDGGNLNISAGAALSVSGSSTNLLDAVTLSGNLTVPSYGFLGVKDGLTLSGTLALASYAVLDFENTQTIAGGTIRLPASGAPGYVDGEAGATITLAPGTTVGGGVGTIGNTYNGGAVPVFVNQGVISAGASGAIISLAGTWQTLGTLSSSNGGTIRLTTAFNNTGQTTTIAAALTLDGGTITGGTINLTNGATLAVSSNSNNLLDGVTVNGNLDLTAAAAFLGVKDGLTLNGTATLGGNYSYGYPTLDFKNTGTLGGTATVQFPSSGSANLDVEGGATLTIGSGVTVQGGAGTIGNSYSANSARTLLNQGTISANVSGQTVSVGGGGLTFINQGVAQTTAGSLQFNTANDSTVTVTNSAGTLTAAGSTASLTLGGTWSSGTVGTLNAASGGTINLTGTFNNGSSTIALAGNGGSYVLNGSTINGGTLNVATAAPLSITSGSFTGGVTINGNLKLTAAGALLGIKDGLTLNGTATMGGNNSPSFDFQNTGTLGGNATLFFTNGYAAVDVEGGATLTLAASVTVHGGAGSIGSAYSNSAARTIINYGTISVDVAGQALSIDGGSNLSFINYGLVGQTAAGSSVSFGTNLASLVNHGTIEASGGGNVNVTPHAFTSGGTIHVVGSSTIDDAGTTISSTSAAVDGVDGALSWTGLPSGGSGSVSLSSSTDGVDFTAFAAPLISASASLIGNLTPGSSNVLRATSTSNGTTLICDSPPLTTPNTADQSGWYQISCPFNSYSSNGYNWTLSGGWIHAGSSQAALAIAMVGLIPLGNGGPVVASDGGIHLYHAIGYDTAHTIDYWSWTRPYYPPNAYVVVTVIDYTLGIKTRSGPPAMASGGDDPNGSGGNPAQNGQSADPVRYFDGSIVYNATDLASDGFGSPFGQIRSWTNLTQYGASGRNGTGMIDNSLPSLQQADGSTSVTFISSGSNTRTFDLNGSAYVPESFVADTLVHSNGQFVYTDTTGNQYTFYDFSASYPAAQRGEFEKLTDAARTVTYVSALNSDGTIAEIRRQDSSGVDGESWLYTYLPSTDPNAGLLANVQMRRPDGHGGWTLVRQVSYLYYDGTAPFGNLGDLKTAAIEDASGNALDTDYYRYYVAGEAGGYAHGLKYVFDSASYARLAAAVGNPFTAADSAVALYAQHYFQYDALRRVTLHTVQGAGGPATGGLGTFTYQYFTSTNAAGADSWQYKTIETLPDGNQNIVYCNSLGEVMLKVYNDLSDPANPALSGKQWDTFYAYDPLGRLTEEADPSAVTGYDETKPDLLNNQNGNYQYLSDNSGLIHLTDYYVSTSSGISDTTAGGVAGYVQDDKVEHGELGTPVLVDSQQYFKHVNGAVITYPQASQTVYRNADGTGAETTSFDYAWYPNSSQPQWMATIAPVVSSAENGPASADITTINYDPYGNVLSTTNGDGYVTQSQYDTSTGALIQSVSDAPAVSAPSSTSPTYSQTVLSDSPVAYWRLDESSGTTAGDASGNGHAGTYNGGVTLGQSGALAGDSDTAASFTSTGYVSVPTSSALALTTDLTLEAWIKPADFSTYRGIISKTSSNIPAPFDLYLQPGSGMPTLFLGNGSSYQSFSASSAPAVGVWSQLAVTVSGTTVTFYLNGVADGGGTISVARGDAGQALRIGMRSDGATSWSGSLDEVAVYNTALSAARIQAHYAAGSVVAPSQPFPIAPFPAHTPLNVTTTTVVDGLGRPTKITDPNGNVTYMTYDDANHEIRTYAGWNAATGMPTGPTFVVRQDRAGSYTEALTMTAVPHLTNGVPDGTEPIAGIQSLERSYTSAANQVIEQDAYFKVAGLTYLTASHIGVLNINYNATFYGYDVNGHQDRVQDAVGSITDTLFDGLGRPSAVYTGTNDSTANGQPWSPTNAAANSNMVEVSADQYDGNGIGDGDLTQSTSLPDVNPADARVSMVLYDWRDRPIATKTGVLFLGGVPNPSGEVGTGVNRSIIYIQRDNLGEPIGTYTYAGDGVNLQDFANWSASPLTDASDLTSLTTTAFDDQGRPYLTNVFGVDPATGAISTNSLKTNYFYDHRGNLVEVAAPGGTVTKHQFDGAGRDVKDSTTDGGVLNGAAPTWTNAITTANDVVVEQALNTYDDNGQLIESVDRQRFDNDPTTAVGDLAGPAGGALASRDYYAGTYYDGAGRVTDQVNVGTNGGVTWARPATVPARSDSVLVTHTDYDAAGNVLDTVDPRGIVTQNQYDALGRVTTTIAAYTDGTPTSDSNQTTDYSYDGVGHVISQTAVMPVGTANQTTDYVYGVAGGANGLFSNALLAAVEYPDPTTGAASTSGSNDVSYNYNALGEQTGMTDQNGTSHQYQYDVLGRLTADIVTTLGASVDGTVRRLDYSFNAAGLPFQQTSYADAAGTTILNQDQDVYNGLGQLTGEYQSTSGPVVIGTTPEVQYTYSQMAGGANNSRLTSAIYPDGRVLADAYNAGLDSAISRISALTDGGSGTVLEAYTYLGLATVVQQSRPETGIALTYIQQPGDTSAITDGGDRYTGLDRFGRVIDQNWVNTVTGTSTNRFQYGYDADGNMLSKNNLVAPSESELYHASGAPESSSYDLLNRLTGFARGMLSASGINGAALDSVSAPAQSQGWSLDALGNATTVATNGTAQSRTVNSRNQLTGVGGDAQSFDSNGNTTSNQNGQKYVYDAWNRLVVVQDASGIPLATYAYDAQGRRVTETPAGGAVTSLYYSKDWQVLEERQSGATTAQYVWGLGYVDSLVERDAGGTRLYVQQDVNHNVIALVNTSGQVVQRFVYDPYGQVTVLTAGWTPTLDAFSWRYLYQDGRLDLTSGLYGFRHRDYDPVLQRWIESDPAGYVNGPNTYQAYGSSPVEHADPQGLWFGWDDVVASVGGAVVGVVGQAVSDAISGHLSGWQTYAGAAVGGAVAGETLLYTASPTLAGAAGGVAGNLTTQAANWASGQQSGINLSSVVVAGATGAIGGWIGGSVGGKLFDSIAPSFGGTIANYTSGSVGGAVSGAVVGGIDGYITDGWSGVFSGAGRGAAAGFAGGLAGGGIQDWTSSILKPSATVARWPAPDDLSSGNWVMSGTSNNPLSYGLSGKWQPGGGNEYAPFATGDDFEVPGSSVRWPQGAGADGTWKGMLGQRQYIPNPDAGYWTPEQARIANAISGTLAAEDSPCSNN